MSNWPADGIYRVDNVQTQTPIGYPYTSANAPISFSSSGSDASVDWWHIQPSGIKVGAGQQPLFWIINVATGIFLTASDELSPNPSGSGDKVHRTYGVQGTFDTAQPTTLYQAWMFHPQSGKPNQYTIENAKQSGLVLASAAAGAGGAPVIITSASDGGKDQIWRFNKLYPH